MSDRRLDPVTEDFVAASGGAFDSCDVVENKVVMSLKNAQGEWEGDSTLGHRFAELARATNTTANQLRLRDLAVDAVQWLIDSGEITDVTADVDTFSPDSAAFELHYTITGATNGARKAGPFLVPVGAG